MLTLASTFLFFFLSLFLFLFSSNAQTQARVSLKKGYGTRRLPWLRQVLPQHHHQSRGKLLMAESGMQLSELNQPTKTADGGQEECTVREQDRFMPIANVIRIMRRILPAHAKISDDSKETIQECVSEYISFVTGEANERCQREQRKTITAEDVLWAMSKLGFDDYIEPLTLYLHRYRELEGDRGVNCGAGSVCMTNGMVVKRPNGTMAEYGAYMAPYHYRHQNGFAYSGSKQHDCDHDST
ncbi:hypothetical protein YC2023_116094 [Brassica napus]